jgi:hypothetical protein
MPARRPIQGTAFGETVTKVPLAAVNVNDGGHRQKKRPKATDVGKSVRLRAIRSCTRDAARAFDDFLLFLPPFRFLQPGVSGGMAADGDGGFWRHHRASIHRARGLHGLPPAVLVKSFGMAGTTGLEPA